MTILYILMLFVFIFFGLVVFLGAPYVPSHKKAAYKALTKLYRLSENDVLVDIGSGDGLILRLASKLGARAIGYEINPLLVFISKVLSVGDKRVDIRLVNFWQKSLPSDVTVVYAFMVTRDMPRLLEKLIATAKQQNRKIFLISFGNKLAGQKPKASSKSHYLYEIKP